VLSDDGDIVIYKSSREVHWKLSATEYMFGGDLLAVSWGSAELKVSSGGSLETFVDGLSVWYFGKERSSLAFNCKGTGPIALEGQPPTIMRHLDGYCNSSRENGFYFDGMTCQLKICKTQSNIRACDYSYAETAAIYSSCMTDGFAAMYSDGNLIIYSSPNNVVYNLFNDQNFGSAPAPNGNQGAILTVNADGKIRTNVNGNLVWYAPYVGVGISCLGKTASAIQSQATIMRHMEGYCSDDGRHAIYFDGINCQLKLCETHWDSVKSCEYVYNETPSASNCEINGFVAMSPNGDLTIYSSINTEVYNLSNDRRFGSTFIPTSFQGAILTVDIDGKIEINTQSSKVWYAPYAGMEATCLGTTAFASVNETVVMRHMEGYCSPNDRYAIYFDGTNCQLKLCETHWNSSRKCEYVYQETSAENCTSDSYAKMSPNGNLVVYSSLNTEAYNLMNDGGFGSELNSNGGQGATITVDRSGTVQTKVGGEIVWSAPPKNNCVDDDAKMSVLGLVSCLSYLGFHYNPNTKKYPCEDFVENSTQQIKTICPKSCYYNCNKMAPSSTCTDSPSSEYTGKIFGTCENSGCFLSTNTAGILVRDYCRKTCAVDKSCPS